MYGRKHSDGSSEAGLSYMPSPTAYTVRSKIII